MTVLRRVLFWLHLVVGCAVGAMVAFLSVTGILIAYETQIVDWADRDLRSDRPADAERLRLADLVAGAASGLPGGAPTAITVTADATWPVEVAFGREHSLYLDAYTGEIRGEGSRSVREALHTVTAWHRWLGQEGEGRNVGRAITGACNLGFLFLVVSGLYLWIPRTWTWRRLRNVTWFRRGLSPKARDFSWHNVLGLWLALPLLAIVASGVVMSYPWANGLVYRLAGEEPPPPRSRGPARGPAEPRESREELAVPSAEVLAGLDAAALVALSHAGESWRTLTLEIPSEGAGTIAASLARGGRGRPDLRERLTLDPATGSVASVERFADRSPGRRLRTWVRWIHTGEALGVVGQTLAAAASAGALVLVWTGFALAWRRLVPRRRRQSRRAAATENDDFETLVAAQDSRWLSQRGATDPPTHDRAEPAEA